MWSVFFVLLSYLDRDVVWGNLLSHAVDAEKENKEMFSLINGTVCAQMSSVGENYLYQVSDGAEVVRTVVGPAGRRVNCSVVVNQMEVKSFMHECRLGLKERRAARQLEAPFTHMDEAKTMCRELKERSERSVRRHEGGDRSQQEDEVLKRSKRGFTYPGTLWCGAGNMADDYNQLGEFAETDSCCRVHDHCPHVIHAFSSKYGRTNFKWHSISHCDCDNDLKACLRKVNDTSSRVVGQAFFNVIGVPCFELTYEEQCAERHWYGLCKRYEKLPVAVLREAVPYDYGGIDVIDELTVAPPKWKDPKKINEEEQPESATQGAMPSPEDASLRNVVTAAEDFIKVLATVSTSQSSTADSDKDATQSSVKKKKKKKNTGKKKKPNRKQKGKGKGRKRKPKAEAGVKTVEGAAVPPPVRAEEVPPLSNFIRESNKLDRSNTNGVDKSELELRRKDEPSNEVMKDEPAVDKQPVSITSPPTVRKEPAESHAETMSEENPFSSSTANVTSHNGKHRKESIKTKKKSRKMLRSSEELVSNTDDLNVIPHLATTARPGWHVVEQQLAVSTASVPMAIPKDQRNRSKERADKGRRKNRKKVSTDAPIVLAEQPTSSADSLKVTPHTGAPTVPPVLTSDQQSFHGPHVDRQHSQVTPRTFSGLRKQRSNEKVLRSRRRKTAVSPLSENLLFSHGGSESYVPATPYPRVAVVHPASTAATQEAETVSSGLHWAPKRRRGSPFLKQTKPAATSAPSVGLVNEPTSVSSAPSMSPLQLSVERAKAQFNKKKRRKVLRSTRQQ